MYVCGPTVYDEPHIGHARSAYIFDVIRRYLSYKGYKVKFVRNVTDVDDKIIDKARKEFKGEDLNSAAAKVSKKYLNAYHDDMKSLGILEPDFEPKATEYVSGSNPAMQKFIAGLIERGAAYESCGDVYFDIKKAKDYGKLSNQSLDKMEVGARVLSGENKKDPLDFALWKKAKEDEPSWDSSWGRGRPGWHVECSVMSSEILGDEFDIHGGGLDLIFPHHENEIAQSEGAGKKFARFWIHHGLLTINGQKMAKSLGNFVTVKDFLAKYKNADLLKLFFLSAHYSHPIDYTEEKIEEARKQRDSLINFFDKINLWGVHRSLWQRIFSKKTKIKFSEADKNKIDSIFIKFEKAMDDDFNMPMALSYVFELVDLALQFISVDKEEVFYYAKSKVEIIFKIFGFVVPPKKTIPKSEVKEIRKMEKARKLKKFEESDSIRKGLKSKGYYVSQTASSVTVTLTEPESIQKKK